MRSIIIALCSLVLLSSCFGGGEGETPVAGLTAVDHDRFELFVPASWVQLHAQDIPSPVSGNFELAYRSQVLASGFFNNMLVLSEDAGIYKDAKHFTDSIVVRDAQSYAQFVSLGIDLVSLADQQETILHQFRAKYNTITAEHVFLQAGAICDGRAYIMTIGLHSQTSEEDLLRYRSIIQSFACKDTQVES